MKILKIIASGIPLALPLLAAAQAPPQVPDVPPSGALNYILGVFQTLTNWLLTALIALAVIFVIIAAYHYLTAAGDPEKVKKASNMMIYAAVAIGVGLLSKVIVALAQNLVGVR
jgi:hypothetical protein